MAGTYTTVQGDCWDKISYEQYGSEKYMGYLLAANMPLTDIFVFSAGTVVNIPDLPEEPDEDLPEWRADDDGDEDE